MIIIIIKIHGIYGQVDRKRPKNLYKDITVEGLMGVSTLSRAIVPKKLR